MRLRKSGKKVKAFEKLVQFSNWAEQHPHFVKLVQLVLRLVIWWLTNIS